MKYFETIAVANADIDYLCKRTYNGHIKLQIEIPDSSPIGIDELSDLLTAYTHRLLSPATSSEMRQRKVYSHEAMAGILSDTPESESLRDEHLKEKYNI